MTVGHSKYVSISTDWIFMRTIFSGLQAPVCLTDLTVNFDERFQLNNINWQLAPNQHWMVTGANGAGKSALAAVLAGAGDIARYWKSGGECDSSTSACADTKTNIGYRLD